MSKLRTRLLLATASTLIGLLLGQYMWEHRPEPPSVTLIDNREAVGELLSKRAELANDRSVSAQTRLFREPLSPEVVATLFASFGSGHNREVTPYDAQAYYWEGSSIDRGRVFREHPLKKWRIRTNDLGFRKSQDVLREQPDVRILVTGDSHTAGVLPNSENFVNLLEAYWSAIEPLQRIEALNGGKGGYGFYNYLGVLEKFEGLKPDVFVLAAFGGNDFGASIRLFRYFNRAPGIPYERTLPTGAMRRLGEMRPGLVAQEMMQILSFYRSRKRIQVAETATRRVLTEIKRVCDESDIRFVYVYIPPSLDAQPQILGEDLEKARLACGLSPEDLKVTDQLADRILDFLDGQQVETIDMRPLYSASSAPCYWFSDLHINTEGHRLIAKALTELLRKPG